MQSPVANKNVEILVILPFHKLADTVGFTTVIRKISLLKRSSKFILKQNILYFISVKKIHFYIAIRFLALVNFIWIFIYEMQLQVLIIISCFVTISQLAFDIRLMIMTG